MLHRRLEGVGRALSLSLSLELILSLPLFSFLVFLAASKGPAFDKIAANLCFLIAVPIAFNLWKTSIQLRIKGPAKETARTTRSNVENGYAECDLPLFC